MCFIVTVSVLENSACQLTNVSVKSVGQIQIIDHSPIWTVQFSFLGNYLSLNIDNTSFYFPFWQESLFSTVMYIYMTNPFPASTVMVVLKDP